MRLAEGDGGGASNTGRRTRAATGKRRAKLKLWSNKDGMYLPGIGSAKLRPRRFGIHRSGFILLPPPSSRCGTDTVDRTSTAPPLSDCVKHAVLEVLKILCDNDVISMVVFFHKTLPETPAEDRIWFVRGHIPVTAELEAIKVEQSFIVFPRCLVEGCIFLRRIDPNIERCLSSRTRTRLKQQWPYEVSADFSRCFLTLTLLAMMMDEACLTILVPVLYAGIYGSYCLSFALSQSRCMYLNRAVR